MEFRYLTCMFLILVFVSGCERETIYEGIYEGLQHRERIINPSNEPITPDHPGYDEYQREREK